MDEWEEQLETMASSFSALKPPIDSALGSLSRFKDNMTAAVVAGRQGRDSLGHFTDASKGLKLDAHSAAEAIQALGSAATSLAFGAIPTATQAFGDLGRELGAGIASASSAAAAGLAKLGPEGAAAGVAIEALGAIAGATVGTLGTLAGIAIDVSEKLGLLSARTAAFAGTAAGGAAVEHMVARISAALPFTIEQTGAWTNSLIKAGVAGRDLERATKAMAAAEALGPGGAAAVEQLIGRLSGGAKESALFVKQIQEGGGRALPQLRRMGLELSDIGTKSQIAHMNARQLAAAIEAALVKKGAGPLDELNSSFGVILQKAQEGFKDIFRGIDVKPFLGALQGLLGAFGKGSLAGADMKTIVTSFLTSAFDYATRFVNVVHQIVDAFEGQGEPGMLRDAVDAFKTTLDVSNAVVDFVTSLPDRFDAAMDSAALAILRLPGSASDAWAALTDGATIAAQDFVAGLVNGIEAGVGAVTAAVSGLADSALGAFKGALGIHSPSVILERHGRDDMAGAVAEGVDRGSPKVSRAMVRMGESGASTGQRGGSAGVGMTITKVRNFTNCHFGGGTTLERIREWMAIVDEEDANEAGSA